MVMLRHVAVAALTALLAGCGAAEQPTPAEPSVSAASAPVPTDVINERAASVVKVEGIATSCGKRLSGTGFVIGPGQVMSMAHAVAGAETVSVLAGDTSYPATVVFFDPLRDVSILDVPGLALPELAFTVLPATSGADVAMLGYPGGDAFAAAPGRVDDVLDLIGTDIYGAEPVTREVVVFEAPVEPGNSGGPIITADGMVVGMIFGRNANAHNSGFALTVAELRPNLAMTATEPVATGACVP